MSRIARIDQITDTRLPQVPAATGLPSWPASQRKPVWTRPVLTVLAAASAATAAVIMLHTGGSWPHASPGLASGVLAAVSLSATVTYLAILAVLHVLPTGYSPVRHAVSDYGVGRYRSLFDVGLYVSSVAVLALALALLAGVGSPPLATRDLAYLAFIPLARIGMTLLPTTLEGQRLSRTGLLHYACAVAAFTLTYLAISDMTPALRELRPDEWIRAPLGWTEWIVAPALALVVVTMFRPFRRSFGLFERIFLLTTNLWFLLAATLMITRLN